MTDHRGQVMAVLYEIGGRYRTGDDRSVRDVYEQDLVEQDSAPIHEEVARRAYLARRDSRNARRGGA